ARKIKYLRAGKSKNRTRIREVRLARRYVTHAGREPVPEIDHADKVGEIDDLLVGKMLAQGRVVRIGRTGLRNARERVGPRQCGTLRRRVLRRLPPRIEHIEPLLGLAGLARVLAVTIETIGAAVDLRRAKLDELDQTFRQAAAGEIDLDRAQRLITFRREFGRQQAFGVHGVVLLEPCAGRYAAPAVRCAYFRANSRYHSR